MVIFIKNLVKNYELWYPTLKLYLKLNETFKRLYIWDCTIFMLISSFVICLGCICQHDFCITSIQYNIDFSSLTWVIIGSWEYPLRISSSYSSDFQPWVVHVKYPFCHKYTSMMPWGNLNNHIFDFIDQLCRYFISFHVSSGLQNSIDRFNWLTTRDKTKLPNRASLTWKTNYKTKAFHQVRFWNRIKLLSYKLVPPICYYYLLMASPRDLGTPCHGAGGSEAVLHDVRCRRSLVDPN